VGLDDVAVGIEVTAEQRDRGAATVDETGDLADRLAPFEADLPCGAEATATLVEAYTEGADVGSAARASGLSPTTGLKALYRLGEPVSPLSPTGRDVVRDYLDARLPRTDAVALVGGEREFVLGLYVETHDVLEGAREAVAGRFGPGLRVEAEGTDPLAETRSDVEEVF
jgi:hypothetical protein